MPEEIPLHQIFYEEVKDIRKKFEEERSRWYWDEINWEQLEKTANELYQQFQKLETKCNEKIDWTKLSSESHLPSSISSLRLELRMYIGPRNQPLPLVE